MNFLHNFKKMMKYIIFTCLFTMTLTKRTVVITGANRGIGLQATKQLAATGEWNVVMACRDKDLAEKARNTIPIGKENCEVRQLDLANLADVKRFCDAWKAEKRPLNVLACNAGLQVNSGDKSIPPRFTADGFELTVGTNHLGHFALIQVRSIQT